MIATWKINDNLKGGKESFSTTKLLNLHKIMAKDYVQHKLLYIKNY